MASDWSLRRANVERLEGLTREFRQVALGLVFGAFALMAVGALVLDRTGNGAGIIVAGPAIMVAAAALSWRHRQVRSRPLGASVVIGTWLAREGFVDDEGRLTAEGERAAAEPQGLSPDQATALSAYLEARSLWYESADWLTPLERAAEEMDTADVESYLRSQPHLPA